MPHHPPGSQQQAHNTRARRPFPRPCSLQWPPTRATTWCCVSSVAAGWCPLGSHSTWRSVWGEGVLRVAWPVEEGFRVHDDYFVQRRTMIATPLQCMSYNCKHLSLMFTKWKKTHMKLCKTCNRLSIHVHAAYIYQHRMQSKFVKSNRRKRGAHKDASHNKIIQQ